MNKRQLRILHDLYDSHDIAGNCFCKSCRAVIKDGMLDYHDLEEISAKELITNMGIINGVKDTETEKKALQKLKNIKINSDTLGLLNKICKGIVDWEWAPWLHQKVKDMSLILTPNLIPFKVKCVGEGIYEFNKYNSVIRNYNPQNISLRYTLYAKRMDGIYEKFAFSPELSQSCFTIIGDLVVFEKNWSGVELPKYNLKDIKFSKKNRMKILNTDLIKIEEEQYIQPKNFYPRKLLPGVYNIRRIK